MKYKCKDNDVIIEQVDDGEVRIIIDGDTSSIVVGLEDLENALLVSSYGRERREILTEADSFLSAVGYNHIALNDETKEEAKLISSKLREYAKNYYPKVEIVNPDKPWTPD